MGIALVLTPLFLNLAVDRSSIMSKLKRMDWVGILLLVIGMTCFILALAWGSQLFPWGSWQTAFPLTFGIIVLALFAIYVRYPREPAIISRLFTTATSSMALFRSFLLLPRTVFPKSSSTCSLSALLLMRFH